MTVTIWACEQPHAHKERNNMNEKLNLSAPWVTLYRQIDAMFGGDPDVTVVYTAGDGEDPTIKLFIDGQDKADAISQLLPESYDFGGVVVSVMVIPADRAVSRESLFRTAFEGNPAFSYALTVDGVFANPITYVVFKNKVVQFWNDNLGDINGNETTLYEDIAPELFGMSEIAEGVCFCTDTPDNFGMPVGK